MANALSFHMNNLPIFAEGESGQYYDGDMTDPNDLWAATVDSCLTLTLTGNPSDSEFAPHADHHNHPSYSSAPRRQPQQSDEPVAESTSSSPEVPDPSEGDTEEASGGDGSEGDGENFKPRKAKSKMWPLTKTSSRRRTTGVKRSLTAGASPLGGMTEPVKQQIISSHNTKVPEKCMGSDEAAAVWLRSKLTKQAFERLISVLVTSLAPARRAWYTASDDRRMMLFFHFFERLRMQMSNHPTIPTFEIMLKNSGLQIDPHDNLLAEIETLIRIHSPCCEYRTLLIAKYCEAMIDRLRGHSVMLTDLAPQSYETSKSFLEIMPVPLMENIIKCWFMLYAGMRALELVRLVSDSGLAEFAKIKDHLPRFEAGLETFRSALGCVWTSYDNPNALFSGHVAKPTLKACFDYLENALKLEDFRQVTWLLSKTFSSAEALTTLRINYRATFRHVLSHCMLTQSYTAMDSASLTELQTQLVPPKASEFHPGNEFHELLPYDVGTVVSQPLLAAMAMAEAKDTTAKLDTYFPQAGVLYHSVDVALIFLGSVASSRPSPDTRTSSGPRIKRSRTTDASTDSQAQLDTPPPFTQQE